MGKHAYLIITHSEPDLLYRMLQLLDDEKNHFYIHIDKKSKGFDSINKILINVDKSKVFFSKRIQVAWGGDSLIKCELMLLKQAYDSGENYSFYHFLSGADFPIKPKCVIYKFFEDKKNYIFLDYDSKIMEEKFMERIKYYYLFQNKIGREGNCYSLFQSKSISLQKFLNVNRSCGKTYQKGSNWCSLNARSAAYIVNNRKKLLWDFKYTFAGDELFIHTAIFNSKYINDVYMYEKLNGSSARYIDWKRGVPYIFRNEDFDELMNCEAMFARKFSWEIDKDIVLRIYRKLMEY